MADTSESKDGNGKRLGFQFKGTTKRARIVDSAVDESKVDIITSIEGKSIASANPQQEEKVLIIPLIQPRAASVQPTVVAKPTTTPEQGAASQGTAEPTLDQIAEAELLKEMKQSEHDGDDMYGNLVIKQTKPESTNGAAEGASKKKAPLLMLNVAPELLNITNENERFKYDISSRAEDLNVRSEIYEAIPVTQFGAALLRGMGWKGPDKDEKKSKDSDKIVPREQRLGLGATAKPPDRPKQGGKGSAVAGSVSGGAAEIAAQKERERRSWEARAEQRLRDQKLLDGDYVWLRAPAELSGRRALVVAARGVPGLDRVRLQLEHSGRILEAPRRDCVLLSPTELDDKPFVPGADAARLREEQLARQAGQQYKGMQSRDSNDGTGDRHASHSNSGNKGGSGDRQVKAEVKQEIKREGGSGSGGSSREQSSSSGGGGPPAAPVYWLREGIRVKVVSKSAGGQRAYLQKGTVLDVYARGRATVRLDDGTVLDEVGERHVESIVPAVGGACVVLLGPHKGQSAVLMQKHSEAQRVVVQLSEDLEMVELAMDDVAATASGGGR